ncbi:E3 ubiquitin-protein ligase sina-like isoform X1 [Schistocerca americana]|uniref:E3 ubiquitin-protein ligase sina-like isoform X1 n=1 Tax=Schistocerca americana TaxID=7009 RepID=UPI001F503404|nr:E3 ubiquitin-protein ligase sina-like isoform X1 [Schistocerca americana]
MLGESGKTSTFSKSDFRKVLPHTGLQNISSSMSSLSVEDIKTTGTSLSPEDEVMKELECPVCLDFMYENIRMCEAGHNICFGCSDKLNTCPLCRKNMLVGTRNRALEKMASRMTFPCRYHTAGCSESYPATLLSQHLLVCPRRPYSCAVDAANCNWKGQLHQMVSHLQEEHHEQLWAEQSVTFVYTKFDGTNMDVLHVLGGEMFLIHRRIDTTKQLFYATVQYLGREENAKQFKYTVRIFRLDGRKSVSYQDMTFPDTQNVDTILESANCACWCMDFVRSFITNGELWCTVEVSYL